MQKASITMSCLLLLLGSFGVSGADMDGEQLSLVHGSQADSGPNWRIINDGVMGGLSSSEMRELDDGTLVFQGTLSLANNGGFASVRTVPAVRDMSEYRGIRLQVKGDGREYQLRLRTDDRFDGISYRYLFATRMGEVLVIEAPFDQFEPVFRGRIVSDVPPLAPDTIEQLGFLIGDKRAGEFRLEIKAIEALR